ncbi:MAG: hypothetical protein JWN22_3491, partial [Nocardioides sp.]|nr:hypothetical protein [Nocardioides sp.]
RRHHRAKTTRRWRYERNTDHTYTWHAPNGPVYLTDPTTTHTIG